MTKEIKNKKSELIHDSCVSIITTLNIPIKEVATYLNINYSTATKKNKRSHKLCFTENDFDILIDKMDLILETAMIKRKEIKELKNNLNFMQNNLHI